MLIRNSEAFKKIIDQKWFLKCHVQDTSIKLFATYVTGKKIFVLPEVMGMYRIHNSSGWSTLNSMVRKGKSREDFATLIENFEYNSNQKKSLFKAYFREFFYFDLKNLHFKNSIRALRTIAQRKAAN